MSLDELVGTRSEPAVKTASAPMNNGNPEGESTRRINKTKKKKKKKRSSSKRGKRKRSGSGSGSGKTSSGGKKRRDKQSKKGSTKDGEKKYELVQAYQTRSMPESVITVKCVPLPATLFPGAKIPKKITLKALEAANLTPREFLKKYVGSLHHKKDEAERFIYETACGKVHVVDKGLLKHMTLDEKCSQEIFDYHDGNGMYHAMKGLEDHIEAYKTIPYEYMMKYQDVFFEAVKRLEHGAGVRILLPRIEARSVYGFYKKMASGNTNFSSIRSRAASAGARFPAEGSSAREKSTRKPRGKNTNTKTKTNNDTYYTDEELANASVVNTNTSSSNTKTRTRNTSIAAPPVILTQSLVIRMRTLLDENVAMTIGPTHQSAFCVSLFSEHLSPLVLPMEKSVSSRYTPREALRKLQTERQRIVRNHYMCTSDGKYCIDTQLAPFLHDAWLTPHNASLYGEKEAKEDISFAEESETSESEKAEDSEEYEQQEVSVREMKALSRELEDLRAIETETETETETEERGLRNGKKRKQAPISRIELDSSSSSSPKENNDNEESEEPVLMQSPLASPRASPQTAPISPPVPRASIEASGGKMKTFQYTTDYVAPMFQIPVDEDLTVSALTSMALTRDECRSRDSFVLSFHTLLVENNMAKQPFQSLIDFDALSERINRVVSWPDAFSEDVPEKDLQAAQLIILECIKDGLAEEEYSEDNRDVVSGEILSRIFFPVYYAIMRPEKTLVFLTRATDAEWSDDSEQEEGRQEQIPDGSHAIVSRFAQVFNSSKRRRLKTIRMSG